MFPEVVMAIFAAVALAVVMVVARWPRTSLYVTLVAVAVLALSVVR